MSDYFPQCWVRLQVRAEDYLVTPPRPDSPPAPGDPVTLAGGFVTLAKPILPTRCAVTRNSYRVADECRVELPAGGLPIDPRAIRQLAIQVFMGTIEPKAYSDSVGQLGQAARPILIPELDPVTGVSNEVFRGFADDMTVAHSDGDDKLVITARDLTSVFLDAELPIQALRGIPRVLPLDQVIQQIIVGEPAALAGQQDIPGERQQRVDARASSRRLVGQITTLQQRIVRASAAVPPNPATVASLTARLATLQAELGTALADSIATDVVPLLYQRLGLPGARGIVVVNETGGPLPPLGAIKGASWYDSLGQPKKGRRGAGNGKNDKISYWDFITDLVVAAGYICYLRTPTRAVLPGVLPPAELVITSPRTYYTQAPNELRVFAYGYNVDRMEITRNWAGRNIPTGIVVSATEDITGKPILGVWPPGVNKTNANRPSASPAGTGDKVELAHYNLADRIPPPADVHMLRIAESLYEQLSKGELEVTIETEACSALPSNRTRADVADMLQLVAGDPITAVVLPEDRTSSAGPMITTAGVVQALDPATKTALLVQRHGFPQQLAQQLAAAEADPRLQTVYRTEEVQIEFVADDGFKFVVKAINYLDARNAAGLNLAKVIAAARNSLALLQVPA